MFSRRSRRIERAVAARPIGNISPRLLLVTPIFLIGALFLILSGTLSPLRGASAAFPTNGSATTSQTRYFTRAEAMVPQPVDRLPSQTASFAPFASLAPRDVITNSWDNIFPILYAVDTLTTTEAWAAGEYGHLVHYTGGAWVNVDPLPMRGLSLQDVKFLSPNDGYVPGGTKAFHYDGTNWNDMSNGLGQTLSVVRIFPLSDNNIWGVGQHCSGQCLYSVVHWDGTTWSALGPTFTTSTFFYDITMASPSDGWVVGADINTNTPYILHYDGSTWSQFSTPPGATTLYKVSATGVGDIWVISGYNNTVHHIYHYNGAWTTYSVPNNYEPYGISMLSDTQGYVSTGFTVASWDGTTWSTEFTGRWLYDVSAVSGRAWAVGRAETILQRDDGPAGGQKLSHGALPAAGTWTMQRGGPTPQFLFGVSTLPSGEAWGVGYAGTVIRHENGVWSPFTTTLSANLYAVQMLSSNEVYIAGDHIIARCDSSSCTPVATPPGLMDSIYMTGSDQGWAVGQDGSIWKDVGGTWSSVTSPTTLPLFFVTMDSPTHGWAGGGTSSPGFQSVLLEYDGTQWVDRTTTLPPGAPVLYSLALDPGGQTGWAAGYRDFSNQQSNAFMRYSNNTWTVDHTSTAGSVFNVQLDTNGQAVAIAGEIVGGVGVVAYHYYSGAWHQEAIPTEWCCQGGFSLIPGVIGWTVGPLGNIMSYTSTAGPPPTSTPAPTNTPAPATDTPTSAPTDTPTDTPTIPPTGIPTAILPTSTIPEATDTPVPSPTPTACTLQFSDVPQGSTFYPFIHCLACLGIIGGYPDGTFKPNNQVTRGQLSKIVANSAGFDDTPSGQQYQDVPPGSTFYDYIYRLSSRGFINGYPCGQMPTEPCVGPGNLPYFRPNANSTRGQISKIVSNARGFSETPVGQDFQDVPVGSTFYDYIYRLVHHNVMSGYPCGQLPTEPCVGPGNLPYFRPNNNATRGQTSKIVANTFFPNCQP